MSKSPDELHSPLTYDTPLSAGQVRVHRPGDGSLIVSVGPPPIGQQLWSLAPVALLLTFLSCWLGVLLLSLLKYRGLVPFGVDKLMLVPTMLAWGFAFAEFVAPFRQWSREVRLAVGNGVLAAPYPTPRSRIEEVPARLIVGLKVVTRRRRLTRARFQALEVALDHGPRFRVLQGYPVRTLEEVCDLLGPALGLEAKVDQSVVTRGEDVAQHHAGASERSERRPGS
jgi:hypothetical protein